MVLSLIPVVIEAHLLSSRLAKVIFFFFWSISYWCLNNLGLSYHK